MKKFKKHLKNRWLIIGAIGTIIFTFFIFRWISQHFSITLDQKKYICFPLPKEDRSSLIALSKLVSGLTDIKDKRMKYYENKLNNCGTEKEYETSPELEKIIPSYIQAMLDEYHRTEPYTIKDFQKCKEFLTKDRQNSENDSNSEINRWSDEVNKLLAKNNCRLISK